MYSGSLNSTPAAVLFSNLSETDRNAVFEALGLGRAYLTRAEAEGAQTGQITVLWVLHKREFLAYFYDPSGTALTTGDARTWSPLGNVTAGHFGADREGVEDSAPAIQAMVDYLQTISPYTNPTQAQENNQNAETGYLASGRYLWGSAVTVTKSGVRLQGAGKENTQVRITFDGTALTFRDPDEANAGILHNIGVNGIAFQGAIVDNLATKCIEVGVAKHVYIEECKFDGCPSAADIHLIGSAYPCRLFNNIHYADASSTGGGTGSFVLIEAAVVNNAANANVGPDVNTGLYYAKPAGIEIINCTFRNNDLKDKGIRIRACDGLKIAECYILRSLNVMYEIDQQVASAGCTNIRIENQMFDGVEAVTNITLHVTDPGFAITDAPVNFVLQGCKLNGVGAAAETTARHILIENPMVDECLIQNNFFDKCSGNYMIEVKKGKGSCSILNNSFQMTQDNQVGLNTIALVSGGAASFFDNVMVKGNEVLRAPEVTTVASYRSFILVSGACNQIALTANDYVAGSQGDGFIEQSGFTGTLSGAAYLRNNWPHGLAFTGSYTMAMQDATPNVSVTQVTATWERLEGNYICVRFTGLNNMSTVGLTGADTARFPLPFPAKAGEEYYGQVNIQTMGTKRGAGTTFRARVRQGLSYFDIVNTDTTGNVGVQIVSDFTSLATDFLACELRYKAA